jgi:hypothetical protein
MMGSLQGKFVPVLVFVAVALTMGGAAAMRAQELEANNAYPEAPVPVAAHVHAVMRTPAPVSPSRRHRQLTVYGLSIAALAAGEAVDSWGTYKNMTHTKWVCGNSPAFAGGYDTNVPGQILGARDVERVCGTGPGGQTANWAFDVTQSGYFSEGGWVTQLHLAGERDFAAVEGWNLANDLGWYLVARHLARRTDWMRRGGTALNFARGMVHLHLGIENLRAIRHQQNPDTLNLYLPKDSNFTAPRWWGRK